MTGYGSRSLVGVERAQGAAPCVPGFILEYHLNGRVGVVGERLERAGFSVDVSPRRNIAFAWMG